MVGLADGSTAPGKIAPSTAYSSWEDSDWPKDTDTTLELTNDALLGGAVRYCPSDIQTANSVGSTITMFVLNVNVTVSPVEFS